MDAVPRIQRADQFRMRDHEEAANRGGLQDARQIDILTRPHCSANSDPMTRCPRTLRAKPRAATKQSG